MEPWEKEGDVEPWIELSECCSLRISALREKNWVISWRLGLVLGVRLGGPWSRRPPKSNTLSVVRVMAIFAGSVRASSVACS